MPNRMQRLWLPFRTGVSAIAASGDVRFSMSSLVDTAMGRTLRDYTVTRMIFNFRCRQDSGEPVTMAIGVRFENDNVVVGTVAPNTDSQAEWLYWEEVTPAIGVMVQRDAIVRDIHTQRRSQGLNQELFFYVSNTSAIAGDLMLSGRCLVLIH